MTWWRGLGPGRADYGVVAPSTLEAALSPLKPRRLPVGGRNPKPSEAPPSRCQDLGDRSLFRHPAGRGSAQGFSIDTAVSPPPSSSHFAPMRRSSSPSRLGAVPCAGISMDEVKKKLFSMSLSGKAAHWYKLLKDGRSLDWKDIMPLFCSKFYPPSEIHKDRNHIYNFWPHDGESIAQAWERLKSLMLKCPNHELPGNIIIDNFYARLSFQDKTLLDTTCSGSFTRNKEEFKRDLLDRIKENAEDWENDKGYADKPPFKPLPPKEGNEEKEKKKKGTKKKKKKENKEKEAMAYPRVYEVTIGNRKYVAPNDYYDNESEYDDLPIPFTHISDHDLDEHTAFDIENLFGTDYESNDDSIIHVPLNDDIESSKLGDVVLEDPVFETSTFSENDDITYSGLDNCYRDVYDTFFKGQERSVNVIEKSERSKLGDAPVVHPAYFKKTQASKLGDAQGIPFFILSGFF
ncbi:hypothetical protein QYE76_029071 [Lolium multiflorum]|uniref:Retrotransposon gag domain-containing protein n=1 Tax=Lolium multiflorum TaxID=4521 RepID=A0AAD8QQQ5_LOLMU|nr:hypothetical protein QYE76_029071 [Lolium multiflorum]